MTMDNGAGARSTDRAPVTPQANGDSGTPLLRLAGIGKNFGAVQALREVDLEIYPGEVLALVGDNGAGKSTMIKTISGIWAP